MLKAWSTRHAPLPLPFAWVLIGSTLSDALLAGVLLAYPRDRASTASGAPIGMGRVVFVAAATALFFVAKLPLLTASGVHPFGLMHLVYVDLVGVIPAVGLSLLAAARFAPARGSRPLISPSVRAAALASLGLLAVGFYATFWEPFRLRCERASVPVAAGRDGRGAVRIGVLTDLQTNRVTDYERGAIDRLMALRADVILLPGDLFQGTDDEFERELPALRHLLSRLSAPGGVYFAMGDVDQHPDRVPRMIEGTRVEPLVNRVVRVSVGDRRFSIGGVELDYASTGARETVRSARRGARRWGHPHPGRPPSRRGPGPAAGLADRPDGRGPHPRRPGGRPVVRPPHDPERRPSRRRRRGAARPRREPHLREPRRGMRTRPGASDSLPLPARNHAPDDRRPALAAVRSSPRPCRGPVERPTPAPGIWP